MKPTSAIACTLVAAAGAIGLRVLRSRLVLVDIHGDSMEPTLHDGQRVVASLRPSSPLARGDIVVIKDPTLAGRRLVKRVTGLPGDMKPSAMLLRTDETTALIAHSGPLVEIAEGLIYVQGDSPGLDSTVFGPLPKTEVMGIVRERPSTARPSRPAGGRRLYLGYDAQCAVCSALVLRVRDASGGRLEVRGLLDPEMRQWRQRADGTDGPWLPTLVVVHGDHRRAWSGVALGVVLALHLGPTATVRVLAALAQR